MFYPVSLKNDNLLSQLKEEFLYFYSDIELSSF